MTDQDRDDAALEAFRWEVPMTDAQFARLRQLVSDATERAWDRGMGQEQDRASGAL